MKIIKLDAVPTESVSSPLFTGTPVTRQTVFAPGDSGNYNFGIVHFSAGSRNKFHIHTSDQILIVTAGTGIVATRTEEQTITVGDVALVTAGEDHWHGAPGSTSMSHITITGKDSQTTQTEP